jgi:transcriptional regulator with XRE-family HTH domain
MNKLMARLRENIKSIREEKGLSQQAVSERSGLDRTYIGKIERGERVPSLGTIVKIANGIGVKPYKLLRADHGVETEDVETMFEEFNHQVDIHLRLIGEQLGDSDDPDNGPDALRRAHDHVLDVSRLYAMVASMGGTGTVNVRDFLSRVVEEVLQQPGVVDSDPDVEESYDPEIRLDIRDGVVCGLILESILRFLFGQANEPPDTVRVRFNARAANHRYRLVVETDNADSEFRDLLDSNLFGFPMVQALVVHDLRGVIEVDDEGPTDRVTISFERNGDPDTDSDVVVDTA